MPVTLQGAPLTGTTGGTAALTVTIANVVVAAGSNRCLVVCVGGEGDGTAAGAEVTGITFGGVALTRKVRVEGAAWSWSEIWYLVAPAVSTADVVVTINETDVMTAGAYVANDVDQAAPMRDAVSAFGTANTGTVTVLGVTADDFLIDQLEVDGTSQTAAPGADQTERWEVGTPGTAHTCASSTQLGASGGVMSWGWTSTIPYTLAAVSLVMAGAGGGGDPTDHAKKTAVLF